MGQICQGTVYVITFKLKDVKSVHFIQQKIITVRYIMITYWKVTRTGHILWDCMQSKGKISKYVLLHHSMKNPRMFDKYSAGVGHHTLAHVQILYKM